MRPSSSKSSNKNWFCGANDYLKGHFRQYKIGASPELPIVDWRLQVLPIKTANHADLAGHS
jgi:hypothetical protein